MAANYSATIQLIVEGQQKLDKLQSQVGALNKQIKELARLDIAGVFEDPLIGSAVAKLRAERNKQVADSKQAGQQQDALNRKLENQLLNQIRLNSAVDLYKRRLNEISRTAAPEQKQFMGRLAELDQAFQFFKGEGRVAGVQAVATELGRILEYSREVTRLELGRVKSSQQIKDYDAQIQKYKAAGLDTAKAEAVLDKFAVNAGTNKYALAEKYRVVLNSRLAVLKEELQIQQRITAEENKRQQATTRGRNQRIQNIALGGGFPLLFGGGPGAVLGGAAGGLVGGPGAFAAQIGLSAIGQQVDMFVASAAKAGIAFTSTSKALTYLGENALFSSDAAAAHAAELEKEGKAAELAEFLTGELAKVIGNDGVEAMRNLGGETTALNKEWKALGLQIQAFIAGPLAGLFKVFSGGLKLFTVPNRYADLRKDLSPADLKALNAAETPLRVSVGRGKAYLPTEAMEKLLQQFEGRRVSGRALPTTATDLQSITAPKGAKGADKTERDAAREAKRVMEALQDQSLITIEIEKQSEYAQRIFAAEMARDPFLVRRLQGEQQLEEIAIETAGRLQKETNTTVKLAVLKSQEAKAALIYQKTQQDLAKIEKERKDNFDDIMLDLKLELDLRAATTEEARRQLRIENEIAKLQKRGFSAEEIKAIEDARRKTTAPLTPKEEVDQRIGRLKDELADLTNTGKVAITVAEGIGTSFANSFKGVISGAMTAQEALASFFQSVADRFLDMAAQIIAKWIEMTILNSVLRLFPGGGGLTPFAGGAATGGATNIFAYGAGIPSFFPAPRAMGGPVSAGSPYMVGERGPELFIPGRSGTIVPNNALGGDNVNVVVNVDASGSKVQGDDTQANQLGRVVSVAVQQELIKQKRPGGLLA